MLNSFPQGSGDPDALIATFEKATAHIDNRAITEAARRFTVGEVKGANPSFAPSVAEFMQECRRVPIERPSLPAPERELSLDAAAKARMRLKIPMYRHATECNLMPQLDAANRAGFSSVIALADRWSIEIPAELLDMPPAEAERQWEAARRQAWTDIERNPPPFLRRQRVEEKHKQAAE
jgi:hypothetical protein